MKVLVLAMMAVPFSCFAQEIEALDVPTKAPTEPPIKIVGSEVTGFYGSGDFIAFAENGKTVLSIDKNGDVTWKGRKVHSDEDFRRAMISVSHMAIDGCKSIGKNP